MSKLFDVQQRIVTLLLADAFFTDPDATKAVPVITQRVGDIESWVEEKLMASGVGVIVMLPLVTFLENDTAELCIGLKFAVAVTENPLVNGTGKPAEAIVEKALLLLHWKPNGVDPGESRNSLFIVDRNAVRQIAAPPKARSILTYNISINTEITL